VVVASSTAGEGADQRQAFHPGFWTTQSRGFGLSGQEDRRRLAAESHGGCGEQTARAEPKVETDLDAQDTGKQPART